MNEHISSIQLLFYLATSHETDNKYYLKLLSILPIHNGRQTLSDSQNFSQPSFRLTIPDVVIITEFMVQCYNINNTNIITQFVQCF